jgi:hypothetical protein
VLKIQELKNALSFLFFIALGFELRALLLEPLRQLPLVLFNPEFEAQNVHVLEGCHFETLVLMAVFPLCLQSPGRIRGWKWTGGGRVGCEF